MANEPGGGVSQATERLNGLIDHWKDILENVDYWRQVLNSLPIDSDKSVPEQHLQNAIDRRKAVGDRIRGLVDKHPELKPKAQEQDFNNFGAGDPDRDEYPGPVTPPSDKEGKGGGGGQGGGSGGGGSGGGSGGQSGGGKGGGGGGAPNGGSGLQGKAGLDYDIIRGPNGKYYVKYKHLKIKGDTVAPLIWTLTKDQMDRWGIDPDKAHKVSNEQFQRMNWMGQADEIDIGKHGVRDPFDLALTMIGRTYGGTGMLKNKEVLRILLQAQIEGVAGGWNQETILGALAQTKWYKNRSSYQIEWGTHMSPKDRDDAVNSVKTDMSAYFEQLYGPDWQKTIGPKKLDKLAQDIASGHYQGSDSRDSAMKNWQLDALHDAQQISGTPANTAFNEGQAQEAASLYSAEGGYENMFQKVRADAIDWLGYFGKPDESTLRRWAQDIATGAKDDNDLIAFFKKQAKNLYPYLGPDEKWSDRASSYKQTAERLLETTVDWKDPLFADFTARDENGNPIADQAMNMHDFSRKIRSDSRWANTDQAISGKDNFLDLLDRTFNGAPVGG